MTAFPPGPDELFAEMFAEVQLRRLFPDGKTFPDMEPRAAPSEIMAEWRVRPLESDAEIKAFVSEHFDLPAHPEIDTGQRAAAIGERISELWDSLIVAPTERGPHSSALSLPFPYVIPGGRFREIYYWDSYFTMLGLAVDRQHERVEQMLDNFTSLIERYGHVPNGTRSYFLSRSQPPFFALMTRLSVNRDPAVRRRRLAALRSEHAYWMAGEERLRAPGAEAHVVRLPGGGLLNRYWDALDTPRPESFAEDMAIAARASRPAGEVHRDIRAACESGWDFSSRWLRRSDEMASIQTTSIVPVDLNCLLQITERHMEAECAALGDEAGARHFGDRAERRSAAINQHCWIEAEGRFADWQWVEGAPLPDVTAAVLSPLFAGVATRDQAARVAELVRTRLLAPGGLRTTTVATDQQWDMPNGWAPLQWIAIIGLRRYGEDRLADVIAERWLATVSQVYDATGALLEKYDIENGLPGRGGEYPNQHGFGWTNGVVKALLAGADGQHDMTGV